MDNPVANATTSKPTFNLISRRAATTVARFTVWAADPWRQCRNPTTPVATIRNAPVNGAFLMVAYIVLAVLPSVKAEGAILGGQARGLRLGATPLCDLHDNNIENKVYHRRVSVSSRRLVESGNGL